jgi:hypothetical protein
LAGAAPSITETVGEIATDARSELEASCKREKGTVIFLKAEDQQESTCNEEEQSDKRHFFL